MPTHAPKKYLISHASLQHCFDKSRSGLEKLRESDPSFPRPSSLGPSKQAGVYFVVAEVEAWLESKIASVMESLGLSLREMDTSFEQIPSFLAEMPKAARASYLNPSIVPKPLPSGLPRVLPWRGELLPAVLQEYVRDVAERTQCPPDLLGSRLWLLLAP
ncbi:helix-turn-helix transcriptional regulator [Pseudomonas aeruginosa]